MKHGSGALWSAEQQGEAQARRSPTPVLALPPAGAAERRRPALLLSLTLISGAAAPLSAAPLSAAPLSAAVLSVAAAASAVPPVAAPLPAAAPVSSAGPAVSTAEAMAVASGPEAVATSSASRVRP